MQSTRSRALEDILTETKFTKVKEAMATTQSEFEQRPEPDEARCLAYSDECKESDGHCTLLSKKELHEQQELQQSMPNRSLALKWRPKAYRSMYIAHKVCSYLDTSDALTPVQQQAVYEWKWHKTTVMSELRTAHREETVPGIPILDFMADIFNKLFFCGGLSKPSLFWNASLTATKRIWGVTTSEDSLDSATQKRVTKVSIQLDPWHNPEGVLDPAPYAEAILSTLAHEYVHACFHEMTCCSLYCGDKACSDEAERFLGPAGHGRAWQMVAKAVEDFAKIHLELNLDLYRLWNYTQDLLTGSHTAFCSHELESLFPGTTAWLDDSVGPCRTIASVQQEQSSTASAGAVTDGIALVDPGLIDPALL